MTNPVVVILSADGKYSVSVTLIPATIAPSKIAASADGQSATLVQGALSPASVASVSVSPVGSQPVPVPPAPPPPPASAGLITNYNPQPGGQFAVGGVNYGVQNANTPHSLQKMDSQTLRFEVRNGENWGAAQNGPDDPGCDRSELNSTKTYPAGTALSISYQMLLEANGPGGAFLNSVGGNWFIVGQCHNDDDATSRRLGHSIGGTSPPLAMNMLGGALQVITRTSPPGTDPSNGAGHVQQQTRSPNIPLSTGVWHTVSIQAKFMNDSSGYLKVWVDGNQVTNYDGPIGYGEGTEWEYGIYRATPAASENCAVQYRGLVVGP